MIILKDVYYVTHSEHEMLKLMNELVDKSNYPWKIEHGTNGVTYTAEHVYSSYEALINEKYKGDKER